MEEQQEIDIPEVIEQKKRPLLIYIFSLMISAGSIYVLYSAVQTLTHSGNQPLMTYGAIADLVFFIITFAFILLFFMLKRSCLTFLYISIGISVFANVLITDWIMAIATLIIGIVIWDYIAHKKIDGVKIFQ